MFSWHFLELFAIAWHILCQSIWVSFAKNTIHSQDMNLTAKYDGFFKNYFFSWPRMTQFSRPRGHGDGWVWVGLDVCLMVWVHVWVSFEQASWFYANSLLDWKVGWVSFWKTWFKSKQLWQQPCSTGNICALYLSWDGPEVGTTKRSANSWMC